MPLRVIELSGKPYDMGFAHGHQLADQVHQISQDRYKLCQDALANAGKSMPRDDILRLARAHLVIQAEHAPARRPTRSDLARLRGSCALRVALAD